MKQEADQSEFRTFDSAMRTILTVSKAELQKREREWKRNKLKKKQDRARMEGGHAHT